MKVFFTPGDPGCAGGCGGTGRVQKQVTFADGSKGAITVPCSCEIAAEATVERENVKVSANQPEMRVWKGRIVPYEDTVPEDVFDYDHPEKQTTDPKELEK